MERVVFFGGHSDAGFFVHSVNTYYQGVDVDGSKVKLKPRNIEVIDDDEIRALGRFSLIVPVLDEWRLAEPGHLQNLFRPAIVDAINGQSCKLLLDFSNESGTKDMLKKLTDLLKTFGIKSPSGCWLLCQNRSICGASGHGLITAVPYDFFLLAGVFASRQVLSAGVMQSLTSAIESNSKPYRLTCLNATPRLHRVHALLEAIDLGLISAAWYQADAEIKLPYISMTSLDDTKGSPLSIPEVSRYLESCHRAHLLPHLEWLQRILPLRVDSLSEKGNHLAAKILTEHYLNADMSVVTETGVNSGVKRITEKTIKVLAIGHPFVVIGHTNSVAMAKELGFSVMEEVIDHSYDTIDNPSERIHSAILSAKDFLSRLDGNTPMASQVSQLASQNMAWACNGFSDSYWSSHVLPVLRLLQIVSP